MDKINFDPGDEQAAAVEDPPAVLMEDTEFIYKGKDWTVNNKQPCPLCNDWFSYANFSRHCFVRHDGMKPEQLYNSYYMEASKMLAEEIERDEERV